MHAKMELKIVNLMRVDDKKMKKIQLFIIKGYLMRLPNVTVTAVRSTMYVNGTCSHRTVRQCFFFLISVKHKI